MASPVPGLSVFEVIGHGGYSVVYLARQESVGREVALKVDNRMVREERDRRRFLREAHAAGRLTDHPNVISVFDAGITEDGRPYLVMELCRAGSLADRLRKNGPLPPAEVREVGVRIADALAAAHEAGVLHRDLKPANILINQFGSYGLSDFGLAATHDANQHVSGTVEALTPAFASPEMFRMERPTTAVDIYGLAATLYALLSGRPPRWPAEGNPSFATIIALQEQPVEDLPGVSAQFNAVLRKALSLDPADRYRSAAELRDALWALHADDLTAVAGSEDLTKAVPAVVRSPGPARTAAGGPAPRPPRRRAGALVLVMLVAAALLALGGMSGTLPFTAGRGAAEEAPDAGGATGRAAPKVPGGTQSASAPVQPSSSRPTPPEVTPSRAVPTRTPASKPAVVVGDPNRITSVGYGPFRLGASVAPLLAANLVRNPTDVGSCDASGQVAAADPRYAGVHAFKDGGKIDFVVIDVTQHATGNGLRVGSPMADVTNAFDIVQVLNPRDGLRYLVTEPDGGMLFVDDGNGAVGAIVVGQQPRLVAIGEGTLRPEVC